MDVLLRGRQAAPPSEMHLSAPYPPTTAALGGVPTVKVDVPICAVFLVIYIIAAASHMTIFQINRKRSHKFILSGMIFGFCMSRIVTMIMRIAWATRPRNIRIAIASNVFVAAGVVLLFVINLLFAQRIIRACHPNSGWHPLFHWTFISIYVLIVLTLTMLITAVIQSFYTLNHNTKRIDHDIQLYGQTFYAVISFLPIPLVIFGLIIPRKTRVEKFGQGRFRHKIAILLVAATLLCLGASFRAGVNYAGGERPRTDPAGYQSKACFYIFNFVVEILVVYLYVVVRVDQRFFVPNGSKRPGDYSHNEEDFYVKREAARRGDSSRGEGRLEQMIEPEEETFDEMSPQEMLDKSKTTATTQRGAMGDEEKGVHMDRFQTAPVTPPAPAWARGAGIQTPPATPPNEQQERYT